ncbi:MAG TPA: radical SAM protein [bacterium]|nr:radical SAM protein [bacterium]
MNNSEIYYYLRSRIPRDHEALLGMVDAMRAQAGLDRVYAAGVVTLSSFCVRDCIYCGFRADQAEPGRFRLSRSQIIAATEHAAKAGIRCLILRSGVDPGFPDDSVSELVRDLRSRFGFHIAVSMGERELPVYRKWMEAGAEFYWLRHETCDPHLYRRIRPSMYWVDRIRSLDALKQSGFRVGTGILVGMPNQSCESLVEDIMLFAEPHVAGIVIEPYQPPHDSPGYHLIQKPENMIVEPDLATMQKVIAATRISKPNSMIPITNAHARLYNALENNHLFRAGANGVIFDFTPPEHAMPEHAAPFSGVPAAPDAIPRARNQLKEMGLEMIFSPPECFVSPA